MIVVVTMKDELADHLVIALRRLLTLDDGNWRGATAFVEDWRAMNVHSMHPSSDMGHIFCRVIDVSKPVRWQRRMWN
jgi:hypothetical protein